MHVPNLYIALRPSENFNWRGVRQLGAQVFRCRQRRRRDGDCRTDGRARRSGGCKVLGREKNEPIKTQSRRRGQDEAI